MLVNRGALDQLTETARLSGEAAKATSNEAAKAGADAAFQNLREVDLKKPPRAGGAGGGGPAASSAVADAAQPARHSPAIAAALPPGQGSNPPVIGDLGRRPANLAPERAQEGRAEVRRLRKERLASLKRLEQLEKRLEQLDPPGTLNCRARYFKAVTQGAGFSGMALAGYGNWCGKGGDGITLDEYDACCKAHDACYGLNSCSIFDMSCTPACNECDDTAVRCWQSARALRPERYGRGATFRYPCRRCYQRSSLQYEDRRLRCNRECRAGMF